MLEAYTKLLRRVGRALNQTCDETIVAPKTGFLGQPARVFKVNRATLRLSEDKKKIAIVDKQDRLIAGPSWAYGAYRQPLNPHLVNSNNFNFDKQVIKSNASALSLISHPGSPKNYYHWLVDLLPKLIIANKTGLLEKVDCLIVPTISKSYQNDTLQYILEDKNIEVIALKDNEDFSAKKMYVVSDPNPIPNTAYSWGHCEVRDWIRNLIPENSQSQELIYVSRKDATSRRVHNEGEVKATLEKFGFTTVVPSEHSFLNQMKLFSKGKCVLGPHGAAMTNILSCNRGVAVMELFGPNYWRSMYQVITSMLLEGTYTKIICPKENKLNNYDQKKSEHIRSTKEYDYIVENDLFLPKLNKMLKSLEL